MTTDPMVEPDALVAALETSLQLAENGSDHFTIYGEDGEPDGCEDSCPACASTDALALLSFIAAALVALRGERDEALRQLDEDDEARAERALNETMLVGMGPDPEGGWSVKTQPPHWLVVTMAEALARSITDDVPNYTETAFTFTPSPAGDVAKFALTVQRVRGKTPHELRREAESSAAALAASLDRARALHTKIPDMAVVFRRMTPTQRKKRERLEPGKPMADNARAMFDADPVWMCRADHRRWPCVTAAALSPGEPPPAPGEDQGVAL